MKKVLIFFLLLFILSFPTTAFAATSETEAGTTPDSLFYWFDKMAERISLLFTFNPQDKAEALSKIGLERLAEAEESDNEETVGKLISEFVKNSNKAEDLADEDIDTLVGLNEDQTEALGILSDLGDDDKSTDKAISTVIKLLDKQSKKLEKLALNASPKAAEKIARVIDKTTDRLNKLLEKLSKENEDDSDDKEKKTIEELVDQVQSSTSKHITVLEGLLDLDKLPDSAKASIEKAIAKSKHGSETATEAVGRRGPKVVSDGEASEASSNGKSIGNNGEH